MLFYVFDAHIRRFSIAGNNKAVLFENNTCFTKLCISKTIRSELKAAVSLGPFSRTVDESFSEIYFWKSAVSYSYRDNIYSWNFDNQKRICIRISRIRPIVWERLWHFFESTTTFVKCYYRCLIPRLMMILVFVSLIIKLKIITER